MKNLYLLRHAKSSWAIPAQVDFERSLNERGRLAAPEIGRFMLAKDFLPNLIVSSPAIRARQTAEIVAATAGFAAETRFDTRIYEAETKDLLVVLNETPNEVNTLLLVGHNPGMENLIKSLTGETREMPTAALAEIKLKIDDWKNIRGICGKLCNLFKPKEIADQT